MSGGQCQRVGIARALATRPRVVILDEPTSALDLSVQAQILNLLADLRAAHDLTYLLISHDLDVVRHMSDRVAVMYLGRFMESGPAAATLRQPAHPYTSALLDSAPGTGPNALRDGTVLLGEIPSATSIPAGCRFHPRCPHRVALGAPPECTEADPVSRELGADQTAACHFPLLPAPQAAPTVPLAADAESR
jgi:oligopeptide/dipeptide ABC transporter ATP-binding protein